MTHTPTLQVLDCVQKYFMIELKIQVVRHQSTESYLQVTVVILNRSDTYTHILRELYLIVECSAVGHVQ